MSLPKAVCPSRGLNRKLDLVFFFGLIVVIHTLIHQLENDILVFAVPLCKFDPQIGKVCIGDSEIGVLERVLGLPNDSAVVACVVMLYIGQYIYAE